MRRAEQSTTRPVRLAGRVAVCAAVVALTMLGNLRLQASEVGPASPPRGTAPAPDAGAARIDVHRVAERTRDALPAADDDADDETQLVPAIYAWDKDVRFVYFRHMSKWM